MVGKPRELEEGWRRRRGLECPWSCGEAFLTTRSLDAHIGAKHREKRGAKAKPKEAKNMKKMSGLKERQKKTESVKFVKCRARGCERIFVKQGNLNIHMSKKHGGEEVDPLQLSEG